jgi:hypothetical protein
MPNTLRPSCHHGQACAALRDQPVRRRIVLARGAERNGEPGNTKVLKVRIDRNVLGYAHSCAATLLAQSSLVIHPSDVDVVRLLELL